MSEITERSYPEFKKLYEEARDKGEETFYFQGQKMLTEYAKYVCQFVDEK